MGGDDCLCWCQHMFAEWRPLHMTWHLSAHAPDGCCSAAHFVLSVDVMFCSCPSPASPPEQCYWAHRSMCFHSPRLWFVLHLVVVSSENCHLCYLLCLPKRIITRHGFSSCVNRPPKCNVSQVKVPRIHLGSQNCYKNKWKTSFLQSFPSSLQLLADATFSYCPSKFSPY